MGEKSHIYRFRKIINLPVDEDSEIVNVGFLIHGDILDLWCFLLNPIQQAYRYKIQRKK